MIRSKRIFRSVAVGLAILLVAVCSQAETPPKLVDVGADKCIPCIKMAPILEQLGTDFAGQLDVEFVDAWKRREEAARYNVRMIPTQIFYAADGKELFRHVGFFSREEILGKWQELGYTFTVTP